MFRVVVSVCAAVLVLAACSSEGTDTGQDPQPPTQESSGLEALTEQRMCDLLSDEAIEKVFDTKVEGREGMKRGRAPISLSYECSYDSDGFPAVSTDLTTTRSSESDQEVLDGVFADRTHEDRAVGPYQEVPGLGTLAGFGRDATLGKAVNASTLGVVFTVDSERLLLTISVTGQAELEQVRPLAEELLANAKSTMG